MVDVSYFPLSLSVQIPPDYLTLESSKDRGSDKCGSLEEAERCVCVHRYIILGPDHAVCVVLTHSMKALTSISHHTNTLTPSTHPPYTCHPNMSLCEGDTLLSSTMPS